MRIANMMVTFVSQCEKKSLKKTRRILDAFADRIGDNVWQTNITEAGLITVKSLLKRSASKNTAVACHWMRSRRRTDLMWIVGNRNQFNEEGKVPVNRTKRKMIEIEQEKDWTYLTFMKGITAMAALLHDWGKSSYLFQKKLTVKSSVKSGDPFRHEWISCLLLKSFIELSGDLESDQTWLERFKQNDWNENELLKKMALIAEQVQTQKDEKKKDEKKQEKKEPIRFDHLPKIAQMIIWIILSHHKLPNLLNKRADDFSDEDIPDLPSLLSKIDARWGYENNFDPEQFNKTVVHCFKFNKGLLKKSNIWIKQLQRWSSKLQSCLGQTDDLFESGSFRPVIQYSRLALMFGDHYYSSLSKKESFLKSWNTEVELFANTEINKGVSEPKQYLDQHLIGVYEHSMQVLQSLKLLSSEMDVAQDIKKLNQISPERFAWQDKAVQTIQKFKKSELSHQKEQGFFIVNMASTGTGKTIANAKIMQALSHDNKTLRYILALGLRTLTLQTGGAYKNELGMNDDELAILIGSKAVQELHEKAQQGNEKKELSYEELGSESLESLMDNELFFEEQEYPAFLNVLFPKEKAYKAKRNQAFLQKPILVCTIDHIMGATETTRGGKYLLPYLRLLSSDLVIDEVDDFNVEDFIALARMIHLVGMCGRKVMLSSATIPPSFAYGFFKVYQSGYSLYCAFHKIPKQPINTMWVDEFSAQINPSNNYELEHDKFSRKRSRKLVEQIIKHRARIVRCDHLLAETENLDKNNSRYDETLHERYFQLIQDNIVQLHHDHHTIDSKTGKKISFGVVRVANIPPCVDLTRFLLNADWGENNAPKVMAYHSRQVLLLRNDQEKHLDTVLKRKEKLNEDPIAFSDPIIRAHIDNSSAENIIFILVATPVEEVGRDHDFDWAVIEPSSYRSIIQLAGRVLRHRNLEESISKRNIAIMQYNLKGLNRNPVAFDRPGFETNTNNGQFKLKTKDLLELLDHQEEELSINALPRILERTGFDRTQKEAPEKLADLEHKRIHKALLSNDKGAKYLDGWINEAWFLTGLSQHFNPFRKSAPTIQLFYVYKNGEFTFCEKDKLGNFIEVKESNQIELIELTQHETSRLWLKRDYFEALKNVISLDETDEDFEYKMEQASKRYGEIMIPKPNEKQTQKDYFYSDQLGMFYLK